MRSRRRRRIDGLLQQRNVVDDTIEEMDGNGRLVTTRVRRRSTHPFEALYRAGSIDGENRAALNALIGIHARSKGVAGRPEEELGVVVQSVPDHHAEKLRMAKYGVAFGEVMARLDPWPALVLRALIRDFVEGDGASVAGDGVRWRGVVREAAQSWNRRWASAVAEGNCDGVRGARVDIRESEAGRVVARAVAVASCGEGGEVLSLAEVLDEARAWAKAARPEMARYFY